MKACFVGLGSIGTRHVVNLSRLCQERGEPLVLHTVRSTNAALRPELDALDIVQLRSFDQMDDDYDAVFITNPTSLHYQTLMKVGARARGFFIEKPVFERVDEDVAALPLRPGAICYVAAPLRYTMALQQAREAVGRFRVFSARAISSSYLPDWRPGVDYRNTYSAHRALGGGVSIDLIHEWDYLTALFGFPEEVFSVIGRYSDLEIDSDDLAAYVARYADKVVELHLDYFGRQTVRKLELLTPEGTCVFDIANARVRWQDGSEQQFVEAPNDKYVREMRYFISLLDGVGGESENDIAHALSVLQLARGEKL